MAKASQRKRASKQSNAIRNLWTVESTPLGYGREQFRFELHRGKRKLPKVAIDDMVQDVSWERDGSIRTGEMNLMRPLSANVLKLIAYGDEIRGWWAEWDSKTWKPLWRMKVDTPDNQIDQWLIALALKTQLDAASKSKAAFRFRADKAHPRGWTADQITRAVCKRFRIPIGAIPQATHRIKKLVTKSASPLDVITKAWAQERLHTGRRFDVDVSKGLLEVREVKEPKYMLLLGPELTAADAKTTISNLVSAVIVKTTVKKKGSRKAKHLSVKVVDKKRVDRYGYIVKTVSAPSGHDTEASLVHYGKAWLARRAKMKNELTFTIPGIPTLDRGDVIRIYLPEVPMHQIVFVKSARHNVSSGSYTVEIEASFSDPWARDIAKAKAEAKKEAARVRRKRRRGDHPSSAPKSRRAAVRGNG